MDESVEEEYGTQTHNGNEVVTRYQITGKKNIYVDVKGTSNGGPGEYDVPKGAAKARTDKSIGIFDAPTLHHLAGYVKTTFVAEDFLVDESDPKVPKVLYVVRWSIVSTLAEDKWTEKFDVSGEPTDRLPEYVLKHPGEGKFLLAGYSDSKKDFANPSEIRLQNPASPFGAKTNAQGLLPK